MCISGFHQGAAVDWQGAEKRHDCEGCRRIILEEHVSRFDDSDDNGLRRPGLVGHVGKEQVGKQLFFY